MFIRQCAEIQLIWEVTDELINHFYETNYCLFRQVSKVSQPISLYKESNDTSFQSSIYAVLGLTLQWSVLQR